MHVLALELLVAAVLGTRTSRAKTTASSGTDHVSTSQNIGDYVAAGFGLVDTTTEPTPSSFASIPNSTSIGSSFLSASAGPSSGSSRHANTSINGGNTVKVPSTSYFTSCQPATTDARGQKYSNCDYGSTIVTNTFTNTTWGSATNSDACWTEWTSYWSMHKPSPATISVISYAVPETTETTPYLYTEGSYITDQTVTTIITSTAPTIADNGGFIQTMPQVVVTYTTVLTAFLSANTTSTSMYTRTYTPWSQNYTLISASNDPNWPAPSCTLPDVYPACQSQWDDYATHNVAPNPPPLSANCEYNLLDMSQSAPACYTNIQSSWESWRSYVGQATKPICAQASITGSICTSLKDAYVMGHNYNLAPDLPEPATFSSGYYSNVAPWFTGWTWPATQAFAPGCTLDCGRCAVTGGTIQLLYFPPGLTHPATEPVVATTLGTVLTSPTYYISFESLYASDACKGVGSTLTSMILPIPTSEPLSTLFATTMPCDAHRENNAWLGLIDIGTASLNVTDLMHDTVPYSIYTSQPYCASQIAASGCDPDSCPTTLPYRPLIVLSSQLLNTLDPAWATCSLDLRGLYDPPRALQPAGAIVKPTAPAAAATTPATPASGLASVTPAPTAQPGYEESSPSIDSPVKVSTASSKSLLPTGKEPSDQSSSKDAIDVLVSVIAGMSDTAISSQQVEGSEAQAHSQDGSFKPEGASATQGDNADAPNPTSPGNNDAQGAAQEGSKRPDSGGPVSDSPKVFSVGSQLITATPGNPLVIGGATLSADSALTVSGHTYSSGSVGMVIDGTSTISVPSNEAQRSAAVVTIGDKALTASAVGMTQPSAIAIDGTTLTVGGPAATISGTLVSAGSAGLVLDGSSTVILSDNDPIPTGKPLQTVLTLGSSTITAILPQGTGDVIVIDGTTLSSGGSAIAIDGTEVSAGTRGLVIGGTTTAFIQVTASPSRTSDRSTSTSVEEGTAASSKGTTVKADSGCGHSFGIHFGWMAIALVPCIVLGDSLVFR